MHKGNEIKNRLRLFTLCAGTLLIVNLGCEHKKSTQRQIEMVMEVQRSHVEGNVPESNKFESLLNRDITEYMNSKFKKECRVDYNYLREGATQSGLSYPKYYLWVTVRDRENDDKLLGEGAIRVAAIDKQCFDITHFVSISEIEKDSEKIYTIFPGPVCERIKKIVVKKNED